MDHHPRHRATPPPLPQPGLVGVLGGMLALSTALLQGGTRLVRTLVEGTVWHGTHDWCEPHDCHGCGHCYHVEHRPPIHGGWCG